jgi:hypothetical protein
LAAVFVLLTLTAGCSSSEHKKAEPQPVTESSETEKKVPVINSTSLRRTTVTSHMEVDITQGKNLIYCNTFQIAWNELKDSVIKEDIRLTDEPAIVKFLNKSLSTKADISEDCYVAMAGFGKDDIVAKINKALKQKFMDNAPVLNVQIESHWILAYAYLFKELVFETQFEALKAPITFDTGGDAVKVKAFGVKVFSRESARHAELAKQVEVLDYEDQSDFIISLKSKSSNGQIILARVEPKETLLDTFKSVEARIKEAEPESLDMNDSLQIPKFDLDLQHSYSELVEKGFRNSGFESYSIAEAVQTIRFKLNEKGVLLKSEARIICWGEDRDMIFNGPFLIYLKEKNGKYPYFAMWVGNAELLVKE